MRMALPIVTFTFMLKNKKIIKAILSPEINNKIISIWCFNILQIKNKRDS